LTVRGANHGLRRDGVGASSGIFEKNIDRSHPSFLEYRPVSDPSDLAVIGYADQAGNVKEDPGPLPE
jgi:hypothetical protein